MMTRFLQAQMDDLYGQIEINPLIQQHWVDALGEFAASVRIRHGLELVISFDDEKWYLTEVGDLVMCAFIGREILQMIVPKGLWEWS